MKAPVRFRSLSLSLLIAGLALGCDDGSSGDDDSGQGGMGGDAAGGAGGDGMGGGAGGAGGEGMGGAGGMGGEGGEGGMGGMPDPCGPPVDAPCDGVDDGPGRLNEHAAVFDDAHRTMIIFGGNRAIPMNCGFPDWDFNNETWLFYDYEQEGCGQWAQVEGAAPPARGRHSAAWGDGAMWIFGGRFRQTGTMGAYTLFNDLWRFDAEARTWMEVQAANNGPAPRANSALVWDANRQRLWVFGGNTSTSGLNVSLQNDVWSFDPATNMWTNHTVDGMQPEARMFHHLMYDSVRDQLVMYGGADAGLFDNNAAYFSDVWALEIEDLRWLEVNTGLLPQGIPDGRFWTAMVHDLDNDNYVLFGGHDDQALGNRNDTWTYDPRTDDWTEVAIGDTFNRPANGFCDFPADFTIVDGAVPERRNAHSFVWAPTCGHGLMFGGKTDCGAVDDVWAYRDGAWTEVYTATEGEACHRFRNNPDNCVNMCF